MWQVNWKRIFWSGELMYWMSHLHTTLESIFIRPCYNQSQGHTTPELTLRWFRFLFGKKVRSARLQLAILDSLALSPHFFGLRTEPPNAAQYSPQFVPLTSVISCCAYHALLSFGLLRSCVWVKSWHPHAFRVESLSLTWAKREVWFFRSPVEELMCEGINTERNVVFGSLYVT